MTSPDGDEGFPGSVDVTVYYELTSDDTLLIGYKANVSGHPTPVNLTNHVFFNLTKHVS